MAFVQLLAIVLALLWPLSGPVALSHREVWLALVATGIVACAGALRVQTLVQQHIPAGRTAVIITPWSLYSLSR